MPRGIPALQPRPIDKAPFAPDNTRVQRVPALIIGLLMAFYWARVLRLAWKEKRRTGRAANLLPPEPLGRALRLVWFPAVGLWIALPLLAGFASSDKRLQRTSAAFVPLFTCPVVAWTALA